MHVCHKLCLKVLLICSTSNLVGCATDANFQWLDITAVPRAETERQFQPGDTWGDLAAAYIDLKGQCRATNYGVDQLEEAQDKIKGFD